MKFQKPILLLLLLTIASTCVTRADLVTAWNDVALGAIRLGKTPPPVASKNLAMVHTAIYDAVNGITQTHEAYLVKNKAPGVASTEAAISAAAHNVLLRLWPAQQPTFDAMYATSIDTIADGPGKEFGIAWGERVAMEIVQARSNDGANSPVTYIPGSAPGEWRPHPSFGGALLPAALPHWGYVSCFGIPLGSQFRPPAPPALTSSQYTAEFIEVRGVGALNSSTRNADQTQIALFWANGAGTSTPPGHWNQIAQTLSAMQGNSLQENARLFALLNIAMADAAIVSWDCKYAYNLWRPITAIREADTDGNPDTEKEADWTPFLETPPFPEYISGHSTFSGAAATVLALFYGADDIPFNATSDDVPGVVRSFGSLSAAAEESGRSRIYGGIHFASGNVYGLAAGAGIGEYVGTKLLLPRHGRSHRGH